MPDRTQSGTDAGRSLAPPSPGTLLVHADVGYWDALLATISQVWRRAPATAIGAYFTFALLASSAAVFTSGTLAWLALAAAFPGIVAVLVVAWVTRLDLARSGGGTPHITYHLCESGVEIGREGRTDWIPWDELWDAAETGRSFLLCPSPGAQYVIPKRYCSADATRALRVVVDWAGRGRSGNPESERPAAE
ncbi:MAG: YcxB family protein [Bryobacterales bacterium]|nr:YcxB family protein [Bryobacterales bacterium]